MYNNDENTVLTDEDYEELEFEDEETEGFEEEHPLDNYGKKDGIVTIELSESITPYKLPIVQSNKYSVIEIMEELIDHAEQNSYAYSRLIDTLISGIRSGKVQSKVGIYQVRVDTPKVVKDGDKITFQSKGDLGLF